MESVAILITALATLATAGILVFQVVVARRALGADLVFKLDEKFNQMRQERQEAAECLLSFKDKSKEDRADDVMDFFDTIGLLVRRKILEKEVAWSLFYWWVVGYWEAAQRCGYIESKKGEYGARTWEDFEALYKNVKEREGRDTKWTEAEIKEFLNKEKTASA